SSHSQDPLIVSAPMQSVITSREAWGRFSCALLIETDLSPSQIGKEADQMLIEYLKRFPDPKKQKSTVLLGKTFDGEPEGLEFTGKAPELLLTDVGETSPSGDV